MHNMFSIATMQTIALKNFPELFTMLLIAMGCYVGISPPIHTPQKDGNKSKYGFVPNRNAYKLNPAKYVPFFNHVMLFSFKQKY